MRNDLIWTAAAAAQQMEAGILARYIDNWRARREVRALLELDDHLLDDMGVARADVLRAAQLPLGQNAILALEHHNQTGR